MFWRFGGYSNISSIDTLLDKPNLKLEDLLEESDLIQELKSHHTKLIEYLRDDDHLHALLKYVVAPGPPSPDDDAEIEKNEEAGTEDQQPDEEHDKAEKKRLKYAYVACEILSCETWSITEALMSNNQYLTEFWDFLRRPPSLDPLQAGYFTKVNETLLEKKTEDMLEFFKNLPGIVPAILQHVDCPMVMDLLLKIISLDKAEGGAGIVDWLHGQDLVPILLSNLSPECNSSTQTSAGDFLKAIITISANAAQDQQSCIGPNSLTRQLVSDTCINALIQAMLKGGNPLTVGVGIVIEVIRKNNSDYDPESGSNPDAPPSNHDPIYLGTLLRIFAQNVPNFMELILSAKHTVTVGETTKVVDRGELMSAWGTRIEPLGFDRFKTCELMAELLHCSNMGLLNERGSEEFIKARDEERERLRAQGAFNPPKQSEDSAIDISISSSRFDNAFTPSASTSTDELRVANTSEDDGFQKVDVSEVTDVKATSETVDDLVDEPLSPKPNPVDSKTDTLDVPSPTKLTDSVRRLSIEDVDMTTPPSEPTSEAQPSVKHQTEASSPHPEDKPAPLFSKASDPNKTPTPSSPQPPASPRPLKATHSEPGIDSQMEGDSSFQSAHDSTLRTEKQSFLSDDKPVVGDYLKMMFVENKVVPTILNFFFRFPWNNFLHNVVYDVVQQVFNGPMDRGYNKFLAFDLFETGRITEQIIGGQRRSDEAQRTKNMRLGYMGHLTLVAEEVVKFGERQPRELLSPPVQDSIYGSDWEQYVTRTLAETRDRDNAILGGFRPENGLGPRQAVLNAVSGGVGLGPSSGLASAGLSVTGGPGLDTIALQNDPSVSTASASLASSGSLLSGFGSSSDDEDEDMDDAEDEDRDRTAVQLSAADTGASSNQPVPLIPPPPAPLNIEPSRARKRLADRLARRKEQAEQEQEVAAAEFNTGDDPFAALGDNDDDENQDPFSLDEEEQDITTFGKRSNANNTNNQSADHHTFSVSRGLTSLFSSGPSRQKQNHSSFGDGMDDSSSSGSGSDVDVPEHTPEVRTSLERKPLDVDDDEEMGEMVAPTEGTGENNSNSSDEEVMSPTEKLRMHDHFGGTSPGEHSEFDGQGDEENEDGEQLVEIAMPATKRRSIG